MRAALKAAQAKAGGPGHPVFLDVRLRLHRPAVLDDENWNFGRISLAYGSRCTCSRALRVLQVSPDTSRINVSHIIHHISFGEEFPGQVCSCPCTVLLAAGRCRRRSLSLSVLP